MKVFQWTSFSGGERESGHGSLAHLEPSPGTRNVPPERGREPGKPMTQSRHAAVSARGEGDTYWTGFPNTIRLSGEDTDGALTLIEMHVPPGLEGPPHVHHDEHQTDHVVEGELVYTVGEDTTVVGAGSVIHCPKGVPHSFRNESDEEALVYDWLHPAGFDEFMARAAPQVTDESNPPEMDMDRAIALAPEYGIEFLMPESAEATGKSDPS